MSLSNIAPSRNSTGHKYTLWLLLAIGIAVHTAFAVMDQQHYGVDTYSYLTPAENLVRGNGFVNTQHLPEIRRTPGYPLLMALFLIHPLKVDYLVYFQHFLCVLLAVALGIVALRITGNRLLAVLTGIVWTLDFATLRVANTLLTEVLATVLISLAAWFLYSGISDEKKRLRAIVTAGLLGGYSVWVRPVGILYFVPLALCLFISLKRRSLRPILVLVLSFLSLPVLWVARNYAETGYFGISTIGAENILYYRGAGILAVQQPGDYLTNVVKARFALIDATCPELVSIYKRDCSQISDKERASYATRKGKALLFAHPLAYFKSMMLSLAYIIFGGGAEALSGISHMPPALAERIVLLFTVPGALLSLAGCWYWYKRDRNLCYILIFSVAYFLLISAGAEAYSRFRVPVMPMYALLIGGGAVQLIGMFQRHRNNAS